MLDIIKNNPFRILGVFSNTSKKEIIAQKGKISAFVRIGKSIPLDTDFHSVLQPLSRTADMLSEAEGKLTLPNDIVKYSLFWFICHSSLDNTCITQVRAGSIDAAIESWKRIHSFSSLQNRIVCYLIKEDYTNAFACAEELYTSHTSVLLGCIMSSELMTFTREDVMHMFCDYIYEAKVIDDAGWMKIDNILEYSILRDYIKQIRSATHIRAINEFLDKYTGGSSPDDNLEAAKNLKEKTKGAVNGLQKVYDKTSPIFQTTMDKLSNAILSKTIAYYNKSTDADCAVKALPLMEYASTLAVGEQQVNRCKTNTKTIKDEADRYNNPVRTDSTDSMSSALHELSDLLEEINVQKFFIPYIKVGDIILGKTWTFEAISHGYRLSDVGEFKELSFGGYKFVDLFKRGIFDYVTYTSYEIESNKREYLHFNESKSFTEWKEFFEKMHFKMEIDEQPYIYNGQTSKFYCADISGYSAKWNIGIKVNFFEPTKSSFASLFYDYIRINKIDVYTLQSGSKPFLKWFE